MSKTHIVQAVRRKSAHGEPFVSANQHNLVLEQQLHADGQHMEMTQQAAAQQMLSFREQRTKMQLDIDRVMFDM